MTLDEAILHAEEVAYRCAVTDGNIRCENEHRQLAEWLKDYKRLKEQQSSVTEIPNNCDLISRESVHETIEKWAGSMSVLIALPTREVRPLLDSIHKLPPVKPQEKTGRWIEKMDACECPYCHKAWDYYDNDTEDFDFCPKCGARMIEPQERSEE